jgi:gluconokinase
VGSMIILLMGAAGAGKTTVGRRLADDLQWTFLDGDTLHSPQNIAKMGSGMPLTDDDRRPWLQALRRSVSEWIQQGTSAVLACSLLTGAHRNGVLAAHETHVTLVYLQASPALLRARLTARTHHFAGVALLESQLALLEEPVDALVLDASRTPDQLVQAIRTALHL